jgi:hypothetical protein
MKPLPADESLCIGAWISEFAPPLLVAEARVPSGVSAAKGQQDQLSLAATATEGPSRVACQASSNRGGAKPGHVAGTSADKTAVTSSIPVLK